MNKEQLDNLLKIYKPIQNPTEILWLVNKVEKLNPRIILEIGTYKGGTLGIWNYMLGKNPDKSRNLLICIDLHNRLIWDARKSQNNIRFLTGDSKKKEIIDKVKYILHNRLVDFLFIDGGHLESQVTADYQIYSKFVRKGGLMAFHDVYNNYSCSGVVQFWNKVKGNKSSIKIVQGIGVITK